MEVFGVPLNLLLGQMMLGLVNGSFYAMLSLGLCIIFGMLDVVNFAHGAMYMMGGFFTWMLSHYLGIGYWPSLIIAPLAVALIAIVIEMTLVRKLYAVHHVYGLLLTFGLVLVIIGIFRAFYSVSGRPYSIPEILSGATDLKFMYIPTYRLWVLFASAVVCFGTWFLVERTRLGATLRAAIERPDLVATFGINVPRMITLTFGFGAGLAALGGVLAAPIFPVSPLMGDTIMLVVFAVVVIGGLGSLLGCIVGGFALGLLEGVTKAYYPEASHVSIFIVMMIVLLLSRSDTFSK
ncbi:MAG: branched-chain amino acid ABC transporter permease [Silicimonas sp.]